MMNWGAYLLALALLLAMAILGWLVGLARRNVNIVDSLWSLFFLAASAVYFCSMPSGARSLRAMVMLVVVALWAVRLSAYLSWRSHGEAEDRRYRRIRASNEPFWIKSLYIVFGLQAVLAWVISLPLFGAMQGTNPLGVLDAGGCLLWLVGFLWESIADLQLAHFKANPANKGRVMNRGLWRYCRHPNYFGECCLWWGYYLIACASGAWWSIPAPLLMTFFLLRVSGVTMLEADIEERRPDYVEYIKTTNCFIPGRPRKVTSEFRMSP